MKIMKWSTTFKPNSDHSLAPVWVNLPDLKWHLFEWDAICRILEPIGTPLLLDKATLTKTRPTIAKVKVEIDLTKPLIDEVILEITNRDGLTEMINQRIKYETIPAFYSHCKMQGHKDENCRKLHPNRRIHSIPPNIVFDNKDSVSVEIHQLNSSTAPFFGLNQNSLENITGRKAKEKEKLSLPDDPRSRNKVPQGEIIAPTYNESHEDSTFKDCEEDLYMINVEEEYSTTLFDDEAIRGDRPSLTCVVADQSNQDAGYLGSKFTWSDNRDPPNTIWKRRDRFAYNNHWFDVFNGTTITHLSRTCSNHAPLLINCSPVDVNFIKYFRFLNFWTENDGFLGVVQEAWSQDQEGNALQVLHKKLKATIKALSAWSRIA
ncbi:hypothetical protein H5410_060172 [Solanum commersonii]|uniref:DUF4283 domain-containing protein n=1 Tax=Solanum commersonii TaxID=4109 RepID=A0A9J5W5Q9_SOLCO|nr:hypothetical protein H5410_060172 [Solanum commersonii]